MGSRRQQFAADVGEFLLVDRRADAAENIGSALMDKQWSSRSVTHRWQIVRACRLALGNASRQKAPAVSTVFDFNRCLNVFIAARDMNSRSCLLPVGVSNRADAPESSPVLSMATELKG